MAFLIGAPAASQFSAVRAAAFESSRCTRCRAGGAKNPSRLRGGGFAKGRWTSETPGKPGLRP